MAAPTSQPQSPNALTFDVGEQLRRKFGVGPKNWDRFAEAAERKEWVPPSGAHVTLKDLARDPSTITPLPLDEASVRAAAEDEGGWVGQPDPTKYAPGTTDLSPAELQEEIRKGNVVMWKDLRQKVMALEGEEREAYLAWMQKRVMQEGLFYTLQDGSKVSMWDLYQYLYANPEREALMKQGRRFPTADPNDPAGRPLPEEPLSGLEASAGRREAIMSAEEARERELHWAEIGRGSLWRRRPTRWLLGLDGLKDWQLEVYAHEPMASLVLGRKYGSRDSHQTLADPAYAADVVRCGPLLGMTFVLTAARDIQLREAASTFRDLLSSYLQRQAPLVLPRRLRPTPLDPTDLNAATWQRRLLAPSADEAAAERAAAEAADELGVCWRTMEAEEHEESRREALGMLQAMPDALCPGPDPASWPLAGTSLVDRGGRHWRQGGAVWVTLEPEGGVLVQAQSAGLVGEQESFQLARLTGQEALGGALMESFLGPAPLDPEMAATARCRLMLPIHGYTASNLEQDPNHPLVEVLPPRLPRVPADPSAFRLPLPAGRGGSSQEAQEGAGVQLLAGIRGAKATVQIQQLLDSAAHAAAEAAAPEDAAAADSSGDSDGDAAARRQQRAREAAVQRLREGMADLGPDARALVAHAAADAATPEGAELLKQMERDRRPVVQLVPDLFSLARRLDVEEGEVEGERE